MTSQVNLFGEHDSNEARVDLPAGFRYQRDVITAAEESELDALRYSVTFRKLR